MIIDYPDLKKWVIHNKTVPLEILEQLSKDRNSNVRIEVARKKKNRLIYIQQVEM